MASFMDSVNKGIATLNVKTSKLMESSKLKTAIANKESEITALKATIGETVFLNRGTFNMDMVARQIADIEERMAAIKDYQDQIAQLGIEEKNILGGGAPLDNAPKLFCSNCGAPNQSGNKFCEKCGTPLVTQ